MGITGLAPGWPAETQLMGAQIYKRRLATQHAWHLPSLQMEASLLGGSLMGVKPSLMWAARPGCMTWALVALHVVDTLQEESHILSGGSCIMHAILNLALELRLN